MNNGNLIVKFCAGVMSVAVLFGTVASTSHVSAANDIINKAPVKWIKFEDVIPKQAYRLSREGISGEAIHICRIRHKKWGLFTGTLSSNSENLACNVAVGGVRKRYEEFQLLAFNKGFDAVWEPYKPDKLLGPRVQVSYEGIKKSFICRVQSDIGHYVIGRLDRGTCTIPYTAQQSTPVPLTSGFDILLWKGEAFISTTMPQGLPIVGWIAARDDIPPDAFLSKNQNANYICRVGKKQNGYIFGTMNKLRDVVYKDGLAESLPRTCRIVKKDEIVLEESYEIMVLHPEYIGRWRVKKNAGQKTNLSEVGAAQGNLCAAIVLDELITGTIGKVGCKLPGREKPEVIKKGFYILLPIPREAANKLNSVSMEGAYQCVSGEKNAKSWLSLEIEPLRRKTRGSPLKVTMQQGKKRDNFRRFGVGFYYPHHLEFAERRMAVAFGAQTQTNTSISRSFVALINLSDSSGNGDHLRMTSLSSELVSAEKGGRRAALAVANWGKGEERVWSCNRVKKL